MSFSLLRTEIQTDKSFLKIYSFTLSDEIKSDKESFLKECIANIKNKLHTSHCREIAFFSNEYKGIYYYGDWPLTTSRHLTSHLKLLLDMVNEHFCADCNGIIVNRYENGSKYIVKHKDSKNHSEKGVFIISYGATRNFRVFQNDKLIKCIPLIHGEVLHMGGDFQMEFEHDVERDDLIKEERYSISFHKYTGQGRYD